jgi:phage-related protein (TIGR01555 family)
MGQSPAGMDATGDSDIRWFYDTIRTKRENDLDPKLRRVHELIMLAKDGPTKGQVPDSWSLQYPSLWQMTPKEEAEIRELQSRTDQVYLVNSVVLPEEIALSRFKPDGWSGETTIDTAARVHMLEADTEATLEEEKAKEPVPPTSDE